MDPSAAADVLTILEVGHSQIFISYFYINNIGFLFPSKRNIFILLAK